MTELKDKVQHALDESRLLILGAEVLLGLQYRAVFESVFDKLPLRTQYLTLGGLGLLLIALALLIWPGAYHRIVAEGEDGEDVHQFTSRVMELALFPFVVVLSVDLFIAAERVGGTIIGLIIGALTALMSLGFWHVLGKTLDRLGKQSDEAKKASMESNREKPTKLRDKIEHVLTETRVVLPGAQALLGFQFLTILTDAFEKLPESSKYVHLASLCMIAGCIILLMSVAAYHRMVEKGEESEQFHRFASRVLLAAMAPLALGLCGDFFVVFRKITESTEFALAAAVVFLVLFYGLWFGTTYFWRTRRERGSGWANLHREQQTVE